MSSHIFSLTNDGESASKQRQSEGGEKRRVCANSRAGFSLNGDACAMLSSMEVVKRQFTLNFSKSSRTNWVQILRIVREHKHETVNTFSNKTYTQFFLVIIKRDKILHFWLLQKFLISGLIPELHPLSSISLK